MYNKRLPELLCPAGSEASLFAAIEGGADAVYLGGSAMNARMFAGNFTPEALRDAVKLSHAHGVKVYLTLNTLALDREIPAYLDAARDAARAGVDALIVADLGGARLLREALPEMELHASTQMSGHNSLMGEELKNYGFTRMVAAREISERDLRALMKNSPIETELFVHGALCVSHSGQCLFSSIVGGRSGNRGECAQPCRLPYTREGERRGVVKYPLSLKDLTLSAHVPTLIELGVASLKIEGRMKSPEYVYETARVWRSLLDENRAATPEEMRRMADAFSRSGFTDGYFTERINSSMLGVRRERDKEISRSVEVFGGLKKKIPLSLSCKIAAGEPITLTLSARGAEATAVADAPEAARTAPVSRESVMRSLCRFGGTPYEVTEAQTEVGEGLMVPVSRLNDLRRRALEILESRFVPKAPVEREVALKVPMQERTKQRSARFTSAEQITDGAKKFFDRIYLPLFQYTPVADGVILPPVIFDEKIEEVAEALHRAKAAGATYAMITNGGQISLALDAGLIPVGDFRLNITNAGSVAAWEERGLEEMILSPELTLPQMRDVGGNTSAIVYGRIPLMLLEKCVSSELTDCKSCTKSGARMVDRKGIVFPVLREWEHRSVVYNSLPTVMSDRQEQLARSGLRNQHFLFSTETPREVDAVIDAYRRGIPMGGAVRRM